MKRLLALFLTVLMMTTAALAEFTFDIQALESMTDCMVFPEENSADIVVRSVDQPFIGELDAEYGELIAYMDYVERVNEEAVVLRLMISTAMEEMFSADTLTIRMDKKNYIFSVMPVTTEYDRTYYEDYAVCFGTEGLKFVKALAKRKTDAPLEITLEGAETITGRVTIPSEAVKTLYDRYAELGGKKQNLDLFDELWPMKIK